MAKSARPTSSTSLIDTDFVESEDVLSDDDDPFFDPHEKRRNEFVETPVEEEDNSLEIEVVDDTPEEDQGKWVANDDRDGEPDFPDEEEVRGYSDKVQKRLNSLTARAHAERRAAEARQRQLDEAVYFARQLMEENNSLKGLLESGEKVLVGEHKGRLESLLASAKAKYRDAFENSDADAIVAAQEEIARIAANLSRLQSHKPSSLPRANLDGYFQQYQQQQQQPQQAGPSEAALAWRERNPWFDKDDTMQAYVLALHRKLANEGVEVDSNDYYSRIDREMKSRFPERFKRSAKRAGAVVAPAGRQGNGRGGTRTKVTLTESQVALARKLGLTTQQMAEQILKESRSGSREFTHE